MKKTRKGFLLVMMLAVALTISVSIPSVEAYTQEDIDNAISEGLAWLAARQNPGGYWGTSDYVAKTGLAVLKFETYALENGEDPLDPSYTYYPQVSNGLNFIFSRAFTVDISSEPAAGTSPGVRIYWGQQVYETGIAAMAIAASTHPEMVVNVLGSAVNGWTYAQVLQDVVDFLAFAQNNPDTGLNRGGWRYGPNYGSSDNSVSGYAVLGLVYAESIKYGFALTVPQFVKDELSLWIDVIQNDVDDPIQPNDGGSAYDLGWGLETWVNVLKTGNLLQEMAFVGDAGDTARVQAATAYLVRHWNDANYIGWRGPEAGPACYQAMYTTMKGLEAYGIVSLGGIDWYSDFVNVLLDERSADGGWPQAPLFGDPWGGVWSWDSADRILSTSWALLVLEKAAPPVAKYDLTVTVKDASTNNPISGATVSVENSESRSGITGGDGSVQFLDLLADTYTVTASAAGYQTASTSVTLDADKTIQINLTPLPPIGATIESCDSNGAKKDKFYPADDVYVVGSGYSPSWTCDIYVVKDEETWTDGMPIPTPVTLTTVTTDAGGNIGPTPVWSAPLTLGKYDIVVDVNRDGIYDAGKDALDDNDIEITAGFFVIPEYPLGTILSLAICMAALAVFKSKRLRIYP